MAQIKFYQQPWKDQNPTYLYKNGGHISARGIANPYPTYIIVQNHISIYIYELWNVHGRYSKYRSLAKVYNTRFCKRMENKERVHYEAHYQKEWENVKNNMAKMVSLLEQLLWAQSRGGTSSQ